MLKRVLAIHDISCFGKCSLTVALPIISACGVECAVLPTAILSTHTGGFTGYTYRDLTADLLPIADHWATLPIEFAAAYSGFLGSFEQIDIVAEIFARLEKQGADIVVDPVMADDGKLYSIFSDDFPSGMAELCRRADVILPNMTEAALLLNEPYNPGPYTRDYVEGLLRRLAALPRKTAVLTGVTFNENELGAALIDVATGKIEYAMSKKIPGAYHGTGDVFGSVFTGAVTRGKSARGAMQLAADFTSAAIERTRVAGTDIRFGVDFESGLGKLAAELEV